MILLIAALLIVAGFVFLGIEAFLVPGFSVPGLVGFAMIGYGIFKIKTVYGMSGALISIAVCLFATVILIKVALKSRTVRKVGLDYSEKGASAVDNYSFLLGKDGTALSTLRPSGTAIIDGRRCNVVTDGEFIEENSHIRVSAVEGTRIIVAMIDENSEAPNNGNKGV